MTPRRSAGWRVLYVAGFVVLAVLAMLYIGSAPTESKPSRPGVILLSSYATSGQTELRVSVPDIVPDALDEVKVEFTVELSDLAVERPASVLMSGWFAQTDPRCVGSSVRDDPKALAWADLTDLERLGVQRYQLHPYGSGSIPAGGDRGDASGMSEVEAVDAAARQEYIRVMLDPTGFDERLADTRIDGTALAEGEAAGVRLEFSCYFASDRFWTSDSIVPWLGLWRHFDFPTVVAVANNAGTDRSERYEASLDHLSLIRDASLPRDGDYVFAWSPLGERQSADGVHVRNTASQTDTPSLTVELRGYSMLVTSKTVTVVRNIALFAAAGVVIPILISFIGGSSWARTQRWIVGGDHD